MKLLKSVLGLAVAVFLALLSPAKVVDAAEVTGESDFGQTVALPPDSIDFYADRGIRLFREGDYEQSRRYLRAVVNQHPSYRDEAAGSVAYWLGRAAGKMGDIEGMLSAWKMGLESLEEIDVRMADEYVRQVYRNEKTTHYGKANQVYLSLIEKIGRSTDAVLKRRIRELCPVLPLEEQQEFRVQVCEESTALGELDAEVGQHLVEWWSRQDPDLTTERNERLHEHLNRVAEAREKYEHKGWLDDRGKTYIRFGPPQEKRVVRVDREEDFTMSNRLTAEIGSVSRYENNELWLYPHVDREANYLFIQDSDGKYEFGEATDIIPPQLLNSGRRPMMSVTVMEYVYRQLSVHIHDYGPVYDQVADLKDRMHFGRLGGPADTDLRPRAMMDRVRAQARRSEKKVQERREEEAPNAHTNVRGEVTEFDVRNRVARFLEDDGTTRTEVYWALPEDSPKYEDQSANKEEKELVAGPSIRAVAVRETPDHQRYGTNIEHHPVRARDVVPDDLSEYQTTVVHGDTAQYHLRLQLDQFLQQDESGRGVGPLVRTGYVRRDSLEPLSHEGEQLEVSDIKPLYAIGGTTNLESAPPYPLHEIDKNTPLALYFEIYHLMFNEEDRTRYSVEYELVRERQRTGIAGFFRGDDVQRTATESNYEGTSRKTEEYILLNMDEFDGPGALEITVRVTDEVTGEQVERSVDFEIISPED